MCLSIPVKIISIKNNKAVVDFNGEKKEVGLDLIKDIKVGDYAIISNGFLIKKVSAEEAERIFEILNPKKGGKK
jgi:hydrogenase expression/formation protein HypC